MPITVSGTTITFNDSTTQSTAPVAGVTSVATGNGLSGGTITTTGTLTIAAPNFNTVGSYCGIRREVSNGATCSGGTNLSAGSGLNQVQSWAINSTDPTIYFSTNNLSGTWKWMGADLSAQQGCSTGVRVA